MNVKQQIRGRRRPWAIGGAAASLAAAGSLAWAANPAGNGVIHACQDEKKGALRVVESTASCEKGELALTWNRSGPTGATGATGVQGESGAAGPTGPAGPAGPGSGRLVGFDSLSPSPVQHVLGSSINFVLTEPARVRVERDVLAYVECTSGRGDVTLRIRPSGSSDPISAVATSAALGQTAGKNRMGRVTAVSSEVLPAGTYVVTPVVGCRGSTSSISAAQTIHIAQQVWTVE